MQFEIYVILKLDECYSNFIIIVINHKKVIKLQLTLFQLHWRPQANALTSSARHVIS